MTRQSNNSLRREIVKQAVAENVTDTTEIRQRIKDEGLPPAKDGWIEEFVDRVRRESHPKVYCDGCWSRSYGAGIGVTSEDLGIEASERVEARTVNVAESLAVIRAIEIVLAMSVRGVRLFSDSMLVVNWANGRYVRRSTTAREYAPRIEDLLGEVDGTLQWTPGSTNPADTLSRQAVREVTADESLSPLEIVVCTPMEGLRFRHFAALKSGRDEFTRIRLPKLKEEVPTDDVETVVAEFIEDEKRQASCLRWVLRGLPLDKAIRKVRVDAEITDNVVQARRRRRDEWQDWE